MDADNPYSIPSAQLADPAEVSSRLYKPLAVGLATFLGSPLAGAYVLTRNMRHLGLGDANRYVWLIAVGLLLATMVCAVLLPEGVPSIPFTVVQILAMGALSKHYTGEELARHLEQEGAFHSNWRAAGIGLLFMLLLVAVAAPLAFMYA